MKKILALALLMNFSGLFAQNMPITLPSIISNHAVFQQSSDVKLWGWGPSRLDVSIVVSWAPTDTVKAFVANDCTWQAIIKTPGAGGPYFIQFMSDTNKVSIHDVLIGETWLCSGQSNMAMNCSANLLDAGDALKSPTNNNIRFFQVENTHDIYPRSNCKGKWVVCDSTSRAGFSAVGYFFCSTLQKELKVPVGMISSVWGGTRIQPWMPKEVVETDTYLNHMTQIFSTPWAPQGAGVLYNSMIHPLAPYTLAGVIWYQGESNSLVDEEAKYYGKMMKGMIESWRQIFQKELPFYYIQIAPFDGYYPKNSAAYLREQQESVLKLTKTGMITVGDLVNDVKNIHPLLKATVGNRLANLVLKEQYHFNELQPYSPRFVKMNIEGKTAEISFSSIGKLSCKEKEIRCFEIAGVDQLFFPAKAKIDKNGGIVLQSDKVSNPVAVRYCFTNEGMPNLFDSNGLPPMPFRTDKW